MRIKLFNVRGEEASLAEAWGNKHGIEVSLTDKPLTLETVGEAAGFDGIANAQVGPLDEAVYPALKELGIRQIAQRSAGTDMYNLDLATENGIIITNVPSYSPESIAEFTVTIALHLIRQVERIRTHVARHDFSWSLPLRGRVLGDMTVAVLGTGRIGQATARLFKGFGCRVIGFDLYPAASMEGIIEYVETVEEAVAIADVVSLHMPPSADTHHLFDEALLAQMKEGAILLNMARGALVDTEALLEALDRGQLAGAGIDTYEYEGDYVPKNYEGKAISDQTFLRLIQHPQVVYTPHVAYYTDEAIKNLVEGGLQAVVDVLETGSSQMRVN